MKRGGGPKRNGFRARSSAVGEGWFYSDEHKNSRREENVEEEPSSANFAGNLEEITYLLNTNRGLLCVKVGNSGWSGFPRRDELILEEV